MELRIATDEGKVYWIEKNLLRNCTLAPHMDEYLRVFEMTIQNVFVHIKDGYIPHYR